MFERTRRALALAAAAAASLIVAAEAAAAPPSAQPPGLPRSAPAVKGDPFERIVTDPAGTISLRPRCAPGETVNGTVALYARGSARRLDATRFSCERGRLDAAATRPLQLGRARWRQAGTAGGVHVVAAIVRAGSTTSVPLWLRAAKPGQRAQARAADWQGLSSSDCQGVTYAAGGGAWWTIDIGQDLGFGANLGDWVSVYAQAQLYYAPGSQYGGWQRSSNTITYQVEPGGTHTGYGSGSDLYITSDLGGVGSALQWNGGNGFRIASGHWAHIAVFAWTPEAGWRWNWAAVQSWDGVDRFGTTWCYGY